MKKIILGMLGAFAVGFGVPLFMSAATYSYVTSNNELKDIEADTPEEAMATAPDIAATSGVALGSVAQFGVGGIGGNGEVAGTMTVDADGTIRYQYVDVTGEVESVEAVSAEQALAIPADRAEHSGVVVAEFDPIPEDMTVPL